jgi:hypothetical protein
MPLELAKLVALPSQDATGSRKSCQRSYSNCGRYLAAQSGVTTRHQKEVDQPWGNCRNNREKANPTAMIRYNRDEDSRIDEKASADKKRWPK